MSVMPSDIGTALGVAAPTSLQQSQWVMWIGDALRLIAKRLDVSTLDPDDVDYVVREAVVAHARHPGNETQVTVSVDDASSSRTYRSGQGRVTISDDLWDILDPPASRGAFTITPVGVADVGPRDSRLPVGPWA